MTDAFGTAQSFNILRVTPFQTNTTIRISTRYSSILYCFLMSNCGNPNREQQLLNSSELRLL